MKENDKISNSKGNWFIVEILEIANYFDYQ